MKTKTWITNALIVSFYASTINAASLKDVDLSKIDTQVSAPNKHALYNENGDKLDEGIYVLFERTSNLTEKKKLKAKEKKKLKAKEKKKKKLKAKKKKRVKN